MHACLHLATTCDKVVGLKGGIKVHMSYVVVDIQPCYWCLEGFHRHLLLVYGMTSQMLTFTIGIS